MHNTLWHSARLTNRMGYIDVYDSTRNILFSFKEIDNVLHLNDVGSQQHPLPLNFFDAFLFFHSSGYEDVNCFILFPKGESYHMYTLVTRADLLGGDSVEPETTSFTLNVEVFGEDSLSVATDAAIILSEAIREQEGGETPNKMALDILIRRLQNETAKTIEDVLRREE